MPLASNLSIERVYKDMKEKNVPKISVMIGSYQPNWEKMQLTLRSILLQKGCQYKIIVSDDGSEDNLFPQIAQYLQEKGCQNYELIPGEENRGIVHNVWKGLLACEGEYVKLISPGDMLQGETILQRWMAFMDQKSDTAMTFCDAVYYHFVNDNIEPIKEYAHPQDPFVYSGGGDSVKSYLIFDDICLGAATMCRLGILRKYLAPLRDRIIYAEDNVYRIMIYRGEHFAYFHEPAILYEYGTGISTNGSKVWAERLECDWDTANQMMQEGPCRSQTDEKRIQRYWETRRIENPWRRKLARLCLVPGSLAFQMKCRLHPRGTSLKLDRDFVSQLMNF